MTREKFKEQVFKRDSHKCVMCDSPAVDAHHIIDRSLWLNGGYIVDNGVSLCSEHHLDAEKTLISCEELREKAGIENVVLPEHFYYDEKYDHWGNIILPSGDRIKGELFGEENVQKILRQANVLDKFLKYVKYPRTYHFSWSESLKNDDRMHTGIDFLLNRNLIATIKMDGENTTMYSDKIHARSIDSGYHESRTWVKALHGRIAHEIPDGWRICGENLYAKHSIYYHNLEDYFYVFSIWNENNVALSWEDTKEYAAMLGLKVVPEMCTANTDDADILTTFYK